MFSYFSTNSIFLEKFTIVWDDRIFAIFYPFFVVGFFFDSFEKKACTTQSKTINLMVRIDNSKRTERLRKSEEEEVLIPKRWFMSYNTRIECSKQFSRNFFSFVRWWKWKCKRTGLKQNELRIGYENRYIIELLNRIGWKFWNK